MPRQKRQDFTTSAFVAELNTEKINSWYEAYKNFYVSGC